MNSANKIYIFKWERKMVFNFLELRIAKMVLKNIAAGWPTLKHQSSLFSSIPFGVI